MMDVDDNHRSRYRSRTPLSVKSDIVQRFYVHDEVYKAEKAEKRRKAQEDLRNNVEKEKDNTDNEFDSDHEHLSETSKKQTETAKAEDPMKSSIIKFLKDYNNELMDPHDELTEKSLYKWIKADQRFEFLEWNGKNDLDKVSCKSKNIIAEINRALKEKDPLTSQLVEVKKSRFSPEHYGVFVKEGEKGIAAGTVVGFFQGPLVYTESENTGARGGPPFSFGLTNFSYIDGSSFDSCHARYLVTSFTLAEQNVAVFRLPCDSDHNRAICFVASEYIAPEKELLIPTDCDYKRNRSKRTLEKLYHFEDGHDIEIAIANFDSMS
jgi:hypothetical protein